MPLHEGAIHARIVADNATTESWALLGQAMLASPEALRQEAPLAYSLVESVWNAKSLKEAGHILAGENGVPDGSGGYGPSTAKAWRTSFERSPLESIADAAARMAPAALREKVRTFGREEAKPATAQQLQRVIRGQALAYDQQPTTADKIITALHDSRHPVTVWLRKLGGEAHPIAKAMEVAENQTNYLMTVWGDRYQNQVLDPVAKAAKALKVDYAALATDVGAYAMARYAPQVNARLPSIHGAARESGEAFSVRPWCR